MRTSAFVAVLSVVSVLFVSGTAAANNQAGAYAAHFKIAVLDVSRVFKEHANHSAEMDKIRQDSEKVDQEMRVQQQEIEKKIAALGEQFKPGTPEYKRLSEEINVDKANFQLLANRYRTEFMEREAKIYYRTYLEVKQIVESFAQTNALALVLRFNGTEVDGANRNDILRGINKPVVFQNQIDITDDIIGLVNRGAQPQGQAGPRSAGNIPGKQFPK